MHPHFEINQVRQWGSQPKQCQAATQPVERATEQSTDSGRYITIYSVYVGLYVCSIMYIYIYTEASLYKFVLHMYSYI